MRVSADLLPLLLPLLAQRYPPEAGRQKIASESPAGVLLQPLVNPPPVLLFVVRLAYDAGQTRVRVPRDGQSEGHQVGRKKSDMYASVRQEETLECLETEALR